jgi:hypothetical protein
VAFKSTGVHPRTTVFGQHERMETAGDRIIPRTNAKPPSNSLRCAPKTTLREQANNTISYKPVTSGSLATYNSIDVGRGIGGALVV